MDLEVLWEVFTQSWCILNSWSPWLVIGMRKCVSGGDWQRVMLGSAEQCGVLCCRSAPPECVGVADSANGTG